MKKNIFFTNRNQIGQKNQEINKTLMAEGGLPDDYIDNLKNIKIGDKIYARWNDSMSWTIGIFKGETKNGFEVYNFTIERPEYIEFYEQISKLPYPYGDAKTFYSKNFKDRNYKNYNFIKENQKPNYKTGGGVDKYLFRFFYEDSDGESFEGSDSDSKKEALEKIKEIREQGYKITLTEIYKIVGNDKIYQGKLNIKDKTPTKKIKTVVKNEKEDETSQSLKFLNDVFMSPMLYNNESFEEQLSTRSIVSQNELEISLIDEMNYFNAEEFASKYFNRASNPIALSLYDALLKDSKSLAYKKIVESKPFINWFGDWKDSDKYCSKITTELTGEEGKYEYPLIVFHGTWNKTSFSKFKFNKFPLIYFAENKSYAQWFANLGTGIIYECFLNIRRLCDLSFLDIAPITWLQLKNFLMNNYGIDLSGTKSPNFPEEHKKPVWAWIRNDAPKFEIINSIILSKFDGICQIESNPQDKINGKDNFTKAFMIFDSSQAKITQFVEGNEEGYFNDFTDILFLNKGGKINPNKRK